MITLSDLRSRGGMGQLSSLSLLFTTGRFQARNYPSAGDVLPVKPPPPATKGGYVLLNPGTDRKAMLPYFVKGDVPTAVPAWITDYAYQRVSGGWQLMQLLDGKWQAVTARKKAVEKIQATVKKGGWLVPAAVVALSVI